MLDYDTAVRLARELVAERPSFQYLSGSQLINQDVPCAYVSADHPSYPFRDHPEQASGAAVSGCFVGEVIQKAGLMTDDIAAYTYGIDMMWAEVLISLDSRANTFLGFIQNRQDGGARWTNDLIDDAIGHVDRMHSRT